MAALSQTDAFNRQNGKTGASEIIHKPDMRQT
jgi:hypothetical protein